MQLLVFITNKTESITPILSELLDHGISGATVVDCKGMLTALNESSVEPPPIFGSLRRFVNPEHESGKMLFVVVSDERMPIVKGVIKEHTGSLKSPNTGVMFTVPLTSAEGVPHN